MSLRRIVSVAAVAATAIMLPALPGGAAPTATGCTPYPPSAGETLTIDASPRTVTAGQQVLLFGSFTNGGCPIRRAGIAIQRRYLVNGVQHGRWITIGHATTTSHGTYGSTTNPVRNEALRAHFAPTGAFTGATSSAVNVFARTSITESVSKLSSCRLSISGGTTPRKVGRTVKIQKKTSTGQHTVARATTNSRGRYHVTKTFACGTRLRLSALIAADSTNKAGRSGTVRVTPTR